MNENIADKLRHCTTLPSMPGVALQIIDLANRPEVSMIQICDYVSADPALSAKFLKVARSPLYMTRRAATNLRQAVSLLGTHAAMMIALSFSLVQSNQIAPENSHLDRRHFWRRALLSALACRALGEKCGLKKLDDLFLAGLLQDIGILAFDAMLPDDYRKINRRAMSHVELIEAERLAFGTGHDEVGYWLLKRWNLPDYLALACLSGHSLLREKEALSKMTACIAVSGPVADHFLDPDNTDMLAQTRHVARECLDLDGDMLAEVLGVIASRMPAAQELFDIELMSPADNAALMTEARDLQMLRQLSKTRELERNASRDALTGAYNRAFLDDMLTREFDLATRHNWPLSIVMIDLDRFSQVNSTYGQQVGDTVLISVARNMQGQLRPDDIFVRFGGEEFVIVLPGTDSDSALKILSRLRESLERIEHSTLRDIPLRVTASFGLVSHMDSDLKFSQPAEMLHAADRALQAAKNAGRNCIEVWAPRI